MRTVTLLQDFCNQQPIRVYCIIVRQVGTGSYKSIHIYVQDEFFLAGVNVSQVGEGEKTCVGNLPA